MQPRMVMHPIKPELNGKELGQMKDPNGLALFNAMVAVVRKDGMKRPGFRGGSNTGEWSHEEVRKVFA
ncbi:cache domain-containing protein, partial [Acinetobacter baumannii]|uniref:cache domain-containing protein n=1 Tax=Acinetobacter baumannii TaxID=470 RepID=UPI0022DD71A2